MEPLRIEARKHDKKLYTFIFCNTCNEIIAWYTFEGNLELHQVTNCPHFKVEGTKIIEVTEGNKEEFNEIFIDITENSS